MGCSYPLIYSLSAEFPSFFSLFKENMQSDDVQVKSEENTEFVFI